MSSQGPRVGLGVIINRGDEVLLVKRTNEHGHGTWSTPGGHLEFGEDPKSCAAREAVEETNVQVGDLKPLAVTNDVFEREGKHYITLWMEGKYTFGVATSKASQEVSRVGWFKWSALPEPLFLPFKNLLESPWLFQTNPQ